ncbi:hypothetical protein Hanom_Chr02g00149471 [Helianthus anomalus]
MDPIQNSTLLKDQACEIEACKVSLLHDEHTNLNKPNLIQASKDDGKKSVDIICYGAILCPYKSDIQRKFSQDDWKFEIQRKRTKRLSEWKWSSVFNFYV